MHNTPPTPQRKQLYEGIHKAARECGLEGDGYRLALLGLTGSKTATALSDAQIRNATWDFWQLAQDKNRASVECSTATLEREYTL